MRLPAFLTCSLLLGSAHAGRPHFLKGQLHLHTDRSADSHTPPLTVARWYAARGYDFLLLEIANRSDDADNAGDARHPSTEALWDAVLSQGLRVFGVASDDAHHYDDAARVRRRGGVPTTGDRGFVMVRSARDGAAIRDALAHGDFYSSTGVLLDDVRSADGVLAIEVARGAGRVVTTFVGQGGQVLARVAGYRPRFRLADAPRGYLRAVIQDERGRPAWVQPVPVR